MTNSVLRSSNEPGELSQWLCHDDSTINIVVLIIIIIFFANMGLDVVSCQKIKKWFVLASSDGFVYDGCTSLSLSLSQTAASHVDQCLLQPTCAVIYWFTSQQVTWGRRVYPYLRVYPYPTRECKYQSI